MTVTINLEPIKDRQPIDTIGVGDFFLVGDASDDGKVKPAMIDDLEFAPDKLAIANYDWSTIPNKPVDFAPDKLAIANYNWSTIPNKPVDFAPDKLAIGNYDWSTIPNKPLTFPAGPRVDSIKQAQRPLTRTDGSALQVGDEWLNTTDFVRCLWNGTYWLGEPVIASTRMLVVFSSLSDDGFSGICQEPTKQIFIDHFTVSYINTSAETSQRYQTLSLATRQHPFSGATARGTIHANSGTALGDTKTLINLALTVGQTNGAVSQFAALNVPINSPTGHTYYLMTVQYRRIY